ncbi:MAG: OmpA family protein [Crocinitomicaceae bacterium]
MRLAFLTIAVLSVNLALSQTHKLEGVWQGIVTTYNQKPAEGNALWMKFNITADGEIKGESRYEKPYSELFAYKQLKGKATSDSTLHFDESFIQKEKNSSQMVWCINEGDLTYNSKTGYLEGSWESTNCNRRGGKMILFRSNYELSTTDTNALYHSWFDNFVGDLKRGWKAPYIREAEMRNFEMKPVLFDHDKDSLKTEFEPFLKQMAKIVNSHTDLRIKIIGHTDSNGTDEYNIDLSERRAYKIRDFLISVGVRPDRIVIEYRGERDPAVPNDSPQGKQLNRRVDFEFI